MADSRAFMDLLREHRGGSTHDDLSDALQKLVESVVEEGRAGKLVITVSLKPIGKNDGLEVSFEHKAQPPKVTPGTSIFFPTPENNLVRQDPRQQNLELREVAPASIARALA